MDRRKSGRLLIQQSQESSRDSWQRLFLMHSVCANLVTLTIEGTKDKTLRALVHCEASDKAIWRQSQNDRRLKYVECTIPPTRMTMRLLTRTLVTKPKRALWIDYTLEDNKYDDDFIVLDRNDKFDVILKLPCLEGTSHGPAGNIELWRYLSLFQQMTIYDRLGMFASVWMSYQWERWCDGAIA